MFKIDPACPTELKLMNTVDSKGDFPVTLAVSKLNSMVCVGNTGANAGIACAKFSGKGMQQMDELRPLGFNLAQTTPPVGPTNSVADLFFSNDEKVLFTMVKGNMTASQPGGVSVYPVTGGKVSQTATVNNALNGTAVLFGTVPIPDSKSLFATDASFGATILTADAKQSKLSVKVKTAVSNQKATCWATISPFTKTGFVTDAASNRLVEIDLNTGDIIQIYSLTTPQSGMIDLEASGKNIFALAPTNKAGQTSAVAVFDVSGGKGKAKQIQNFLLSGIKSTVQGMAVYSNE
jgi:hypothetical protein